VPAPNSNDAGDNEILYALECAAAHALVTEDRGIHEKAKARGLVDRIYTIQTAHDLLRRLHETIQVVLPNIEERTFPRSPRTLDSIFSTVYGQAIPGLTLGSLRKLAKVSGLGSPGKSLAVSGRFAFTQRSGMNA